VLRPIHQLVRAPHAPPHAGLLPSDPGQPGGGAPGLHLLQLPSPPTGAPQQYVLLPGGGGLLEVNRVCHEYGAWLVGDRLHAGAGGGGGPRVGGQPVYGGPCPLGTTPKGPAGRLPAPSRRPAALQPPPGQGPLPGPHPAARGTARRPPPPDADGSCYLCSRVDPAYVFLALLDLSAEQQQEAGGGGSASGMFQEASSLLCIDRWGTAWLDGRAGCPTRARRARPARPGRHRTPGLSPAIRLVSWHALTQARRA
jgi:hypothetical protein